MKTLVTKRLILRDLKLTDAKSFYAYAKKPIIGPMAGWEPHQSLEESIQILKSMIREQEIWAITLKESDLIIGTIGLHVRNFENAMENRREIGYVLDDYYWGQGFMVEAVFKILEYAFNDLDLDEVTCGHMVNNNQSRRVIEKTGFHYIGEEVRDYLKHDQVNLKLYKISKKDYKEMRLNDTAKA